MRKILRLCILMMVSFNNLSANDSWKELYDYIENNNFGRDGKKVDKEFCKKFDAFSYEKAKCPAIGDGVVNHNATKKRQNQSEYMKKKFQESASFSDEMNNLYLTNKPEFYRRFKTSEVAEKIKLNNKFMSASSSNGSLPAIDDKFQDAKKYSGLETEELLSLMNVALENYMQYQPNCTSFDYNIQRGLRHTFSMDELENYRKDNYKKNLKYVDINSEEYKNRFETWYSKTKLENFQSNNSESEMSTYSPRRKAVWRQICEKKPMLKTLTTTESTNPPSTLKKCSVNLGHHFKNNVWLIEKTTINNILNNDSFKELQKCVEASNTKQVNKIYIESSSNLFKNGYPANDAFCERGFLGLSKARAESAKELVPPILSALKLENVSTDKITLSYTGSNGDGTSGPCPYSGESTQKKLDSEDTKALEDAKHVNIVIELGNEKAQEQKPSYSKEVEHTDVPTHRCIDISFTCLEQANLYQIDADSGSSSKPAKTKEVK
ncbi:MAG: hypothetical protein JNM93_01370 [Bacteriovoracaceae bacterium]|nr:hypothetical protein [Bacteriovoracaceae bacterium]